MGGRDWSGLGKGMDPCSVVLRGEKDRWREKRIDGGRKG